MRLSRISSYGLQGGSEEPTINLTPLIDVVFVILIMFIVIAPVLDLDKVDLADAGGGPETASVTEAGPITIHVLQDDTIKINNQVVTYEQLILLLRQAKERHPDAHPQVYHDRRAKFGTYQAIKNAAENSGFDSMDIVLKPG